MTSIDDQTHEFQTRFGFRGKTIIPRSKQRLIGAAIDDPRNIPTFQPFDMLREPGESLRVWQHDTMRIGVESVAAPTEFRRNVDFDEMWFQFAGVSHAETEQGVIELKPGEIAIIPAGIAHRSTGTGGSLRVFVQIREILDVEMGLDKLLSHSEFTVHRNGIDTADAARTPNGPDDEIIEIMTCWDDADDAAPNRFRRRYGDLVGTASGGRPVVTTRAFDVFHEITGQSGPGPVVVRSPSTMVEVYNTEGEQDGFHRALGSDELWLQFRGGSTNESEFGIYDLNPGQMNHVPPGIAHRVIGSEGFLRLVIYSSRTWQLLVDPVGGHHQATTFSVDEEVIQPPSWRVANAL